MTQKRTLDDIKAELGDQWRETADAILDVVEERLALMGMVGNLGQWAINELREALDIPDNDDDDAVDG